MGPSQDARALALIFGGGFVTVDSTGIGLFPGLTIVSSVTRNAVGNVALFGVLIERMNQGMEPFLKYMAPLPPPDHYNVSLEERPVTWFIRTATSPN
jgi:hypothetical protein